MVANVCVKFSNKEWDAGNQSDEDTGSLVQSEAGLPRAEFAKREVARK